MSIDIVSEGRRHYITGNTYPVRDRIRSLGAHWDAERKAWWTGKRDEAEQLVAKLNEQATARCEQERREGISLTDRVIRGRCKYKGKTYYILAHGISQSSGRPYAKLCSRDGSMVFWASAEHMPTLRVIKEYDEPKSIQSLRDYAARAQQGGGGRLEDGYYYGPGGEVLASGCGECSRRGSMCRSCQHDYE